MKKSTIYLIRGLLIFLFILIPSLLNALSLHQGVQLGAAPTLLLYGIFFWLIIRTCKGKLDPLRKSTLAVPAPQVSDIESKSIELVAQPIYKVTPHLVCQAKQEKKEKRIQPKNILIFFVLLALGASFVFIAIRENSHKVQLHEQYDAGYDAGYSAGSSSRDEEISRLEEDNYKLQKKVSDNMLDDIFNGENNQSALAKMLE